MILGMANMLDLSGTEPGVVIEPLRNRKGKAQFGFSDKYKIRI